MQRYSNFILITLLFTLIYLPGHAQLDRLDTEFMLEDLRKLSHDAAEGRRTGTKGAEAARRFIIKQLEDMRAKSLQDDYRHPFTFTTSRGDTIQGENIVAYIKGEEQTAFVITAHYDHLGVRNGEVYNGADDNASGVAALLALVEYFKSNKPRHTLVFAALDGEEMGLQGAKAFVNDMSIPQELLKLNINMDMISMNDKNELYVAGTSHYPNLKPIIEKVDVLPLQLKFGHDTPDLGNDDWTNASDHGPFHQKGIPFLYFGVEDHANYHKPTDDFENVNQDFYIKAAHAILDCILALDASLN
ncbi:M20/M25/M40 family metallo-hydrolase [Roseivirga sp.]|uniref:M20/M25/M40 family metallo-hydrolase n=1 Tax=Roseivirga sp. TaxID=1964215 RepID=UPI003B517875